MKPLDRLLEVRDKKERLVLGLCSGPSADGIDAALTWIRGSGLGVVVEFVAGRTKPYPPGLRDAILALPNGRTSDVCRLHYEVGEAFAAAALSVIEEAGLTSSRVDLIGSHGQTAYHIPRGPHVAPAVLQIGEADVIAEKTRIPVVADFRARDVAAGGDGGPLLPYVDYLMYRQVGSALVMLHLGGIASLSLVAEDLEQVVAFDAGPGNLPLDHLVRVLTRGREGFDRGGKHAMRGRVDEELLARLHEHPFLARTPPRSASRETFGPEWVMDVLGSKGNDSVLDVLATMTVFAAEAIARAVENHLLARAPVREVVVSGGGVENQTLMAHLRRLLAPLPVTSIAERGVEPALKAAIGYAVLASESLCGNPDNVPAATGASWPVVLGKFCP